ncbi:MAG: L-aspartate oxidase [Eubacteriales bacterium]|nr:L-aspartate oxidase [Eubacteriales bacterium]
MITDVLIIGCGVAGLYCALNLPEDLNIVMVTKDEASKSDSFLAQGGICVLRDANDYTAFFEDTMKAGHYENNPDSVDIMIRSSQDVIIDLLSYGVCFEMNGEEFSYTREGAHTKPRVLFYEDETGKEITSHLLDTARKRKNITLIENFTMVDLVREKNECRGIIGHNLNGEYSAIHANYTILATGGIGGLFQHSTNYRHLTGDALALALKYDIKLRNIDYIQIHPTTLFTHKEGRKFLISESVRGEGAVLLNSKGERFVNELLPRDVVTNAIHEEMKKEGSEHVWLSLAPIPVEKIMTHFPNIYQHCLDEGYDVTKEPIPVVPSQHYFMGGIDVDTHGKTSMDRLYAVGETACNGVHGKNRLASNSLLESLVFAKRAARHISAHYSVTDLPVETEIDESLYQNYQAEYKQAVLEAIEKEK